MWDATSHSERADLIGAFWTVAARWQHADLLKTTPIEFVSVEEETSARTILMGGNLPRAHTLVQGVLGDRQMLGSSVSVHPGRGLLLNVQALGEQISDPLGNGLHVLVVELHLHVV